MSGTLKIGGKTLATHNSNTNIAKIQLGSANDVVLADSAGNNILSESGGTVTLGNANLTSTNTFPTGHVIQTVTDQYVSSSAITVSTTSNDYLGSYLQCTITPKANGNKLFIQAFIHGISNQATDARSLHSGFAYDASFSSGNGTTIGPRAVIADYSNYINQNHTLLGNLQYSIIVTVGTEAPSEGSASTIRPIFQSTVGDIQIAANSSGGLGVFSMMVMEIQA